MLYDKRWEKKPATDAEIYARAADAIRDHGHSKGLLRDNGGAMCVFGALNYVVAGDAYKCDGYRLLAPLSDLIDQGVVGWNNRPETTKRQVIALLRKAARKHALVSQ